MKLGTSFSFGAMGDDPSQIRDFAQTLEGSGFDYMTMGGHLLSAVADRYPERPSFTYVGPFREPFTLFSHLAAVTQRLEFFSSIMILPLFQTAVVAKLAAEVSLLSNGRFNLGVGISWNAHEYEAVGQGFKNRARRYEEQIELLRLFWTQPQVTFKGRYNTVDAMGVHALPKAPVPIWFGTGMEEQPLRRAARLGDGWLPTGDPTDAVPRLQQYLREAGRDPASFGLMLRLVATPEGPDAWIAAAKKLQSLGASHITIGAPPGTPRSEELAKITEARNAVAAAL
jgi:probable F420-dependent oxidoreductase